MSKILIHEFWYDYVKPKHGEKAKLCTWIQTALQSMEKQKTFTWMINGRLYSIETKNI